MNPQETAEKHPGCLLWVMMVLAFFAGIGIWIGASAMEAKAYNNVTGSNVSTWDAMWIELRVQDAPKPSK